ncbi:MAG: pitrilysin family protein [Caldilineaceae bacterium]
MAADSNLLLDGIQAEPFLLYRYRLSNGLRIWYQPRPDSTSVTVLLSVDVGSRDETRENNGISHLLEHLLFTGSKRWNEEQLKEFIPELGGNWNGMTDMERTLYYAQVAPQDFTAALDWLVELVFRPRFDPAVFDKELNVVFQEKSGAQGALVAALNKLGLGYDLDGSVRAALFEDPAIHFPVIGQDETLAALTNADVLHHYATYYRPDNMTLIVVGNVQPDLLKTAVLGQLGGLAANTNSLPRRSPLVSANTGPYEIAVRGPTLSDQVRVMMGFLAVGRLHPDYWRLEVLTELLTNRLTDVLRYQQGLVYRLGAYQVAFNDGGYLVIATTAARADAAGATAQIDSELQMLASHGVETQELEHAKRALIGRLALFLDDNFNRAQWLAEWASVLPDDQLVPDFRRDLGAVTAEEVVEALQHYSVPKHRYTAQHIPFVTVADFPAQACAVVLGLALVLIAGRLRRQQRKQ